MRFRDAAHIDLGSFYARQPIRGRIYRYAGYGACVAVLAYSGDPRRIAALLVVLGVAWVMAWKREIGALWRSSLVAAMAMCAVILTCDRLGVVLVHGPCPATASCPANSPAAAPVTPDPHAGEAHP